MVRKLPQCKHIFHDQCLMKWLDGPTQQDSQKCPMCNIPLSVQLLEQAIAEETAKHSLGNEGIFAKRAEEAKEGARNQRRAREDSLRA